MAGADNDEEQDVEMATEAADTAATAMTAASTGTVGTPETPLDPMLAPTPVTIACGCRRGRKDPSVIAEPRYSWWATATLLFGVTAPPKSLEYQCLKCRKVIAVETDAETIRRHTF